MPQPQKYERREDFTDRDGDDTNHAALNDELDAAALSINQLRENLGQIQRDDGALKNGVVTADSLADSAFDAVLGNVAGVAAEASAAADRSTLFATQAEAERVAAEAARNAAQASQTAAANSATAASNSQAAAANSATASATSATNSANSATASANSATASATSATNSANSATASQTARTGSEAARDAAISARDAAQASQAAAASSASSASASATAAAASYDSFDDRYLGPKSSDPSTDNDGNPLLVGAIYFNSVSATMRVWNGAGWQDQAQPPDTLSERSFLATAGQTTYTFTGGYRVGYTFVWVNGALLNTSDVTATNGTTITFTSPLTLNDEVRILSFKAVGTVAVSDINGLQTALDSKANTSDVNSALALKANTSDVNAALALKANDADVVKLTGNQTVGGDKTFSGNTSGSLVRGLFRKDNPAVVAFSKTGNFTVSTATTIFVEINGTVRTIASGTVVSMPSATNGTDYAIWARPDGTLEATSNHTSPPVAGSRRIGGFHYAPGGNATGQSGGNTTAQINEFSFWDLKWRPACADPRGMTLVAGGFWADIYLTGVEAITNGSSRFNVTMADGSSPPRVPTMFGGNGSTTYGSYTWFEAMELATAFGKRCPTQQEFMALAYGTTEASSVGTDQVSTILNAAYTSRWGVIQATGVLWIWGCDRGGPFAGASWNANTEGRGSEYNAPNSALFGGLWDNGSISGSRCSTWNSAASLSSNIIGSRFVCDHLQLD